MDPKQFWNRGYLGGGVIQVPGLRYLGTLCGGADTTRESWGTNLILVLRYLFLGLRYLGTLCGGADTRKSCGSNLILGLRYLVLGLGT